MATSPQDNPSPAQDTAAATTASKSTIAAQSTKDTRAPVSVDEEARQIFWRAGAGIAVIGVLLVALLAWLIPTLGLTPGFDADADAEDEPEPVQISGNEPTGFFVKRGKTMQQGVDGETVSPGDLLRFFVKTSEAKHVVILSQDGAGFVRTYYPPPETSQRVDAEQQTLLAGSVELNDTLGVETLYFFLCDAKAKLRTLREILIFGEVTEELPGCMAHRTRLNKVANR